MQINGLVVQFSYLNNEVWITFGKYSGTLSELIAFRKSFDYEVYRFGNGCFRGAKWDTIIADDKEHCYPRAISLCNQEGEIIICWSDFEILLSSARDFAARNLEKL